MLCASNLKPTTRAKRARRFREQYLVRKSRLSPYWSIDDWGRGCRIGKEKVKGIDLVGVGDVAVGRTFCAKREGVCVYACLITIKSLELLVTVHKSLK